ncbi:hypothetical protein V2J09_003111 [Rumex salicifolius]
MVSPKFMRPRAGGGGSSNCGPSPNLFVANCGPAVGLSLDAISSAFASFGELKGVFPADQSGARVIVSYADEASAQAALSALDGRPFSALAGRVLHIRFSVHRPPSPAKHHDSLEVALTASELNIPGIYLFHDFVTKKEEEELVAAVDARPWNSLAKRRVQHYGFEFSYQTRNVDPKRHLGKLPSFVSPIVERISTCPDLDAATNIQLDQLTVNEYPPGVGLSPHIDTHSAFEDAIFSLSLAGPCIMELRRYEDGMWKSEHPTNEVDMMTEETMEHSISLLRKAIYLPPRSLLVLSGEGRYAWHHYIPHHKFDLVKDKLIKRSSRRVSFTLRKVRIGPCRKVAQAAASHNNSRRWRSARATARPCWGKPAACAVVGANPASHYCSDTGERRRRSSGQKTSGGSGR